MRLVMRVLLYESALSWAMVLAGWLRVGVRAWPFAMDTLKSGFPGRAWRLGLGILAGLPVVAGWPVLLSPALPKDTSWGWLKIAAPWWVLLGAVGSLLLVAKLIEVTSRTEGRTGCRCGVCVARDL